MLVYQRVTRMVPVFPVSSSLPGTTAAFSCWFTRKVPSWNKRRQGPSLLRTSALTFGRLLWQLENIWNIYERIMGKSDYGQFVEKIWVWVNTYRYIFSGMNIHLPAILGFTRYQGFDPSPYGKFCSLMVLGKGFLGLQVDMDFSGC